MAQRIFKPKAAAKPAAKSIGVRSDWPRTLPGLIALMALIPPSRKLPRFEKLLGDEHEATLQGMLYSGRPVEGWEWLMKACRPQFPFDDLKRALEDLPARLHAPAEYVRFREARILLHELAQAIQYPDDYRALVLDEKREHNPTTDLEGRRKFWEGKWVEDLQPFEIGLGWPLYRPAITISIDKRTNQVRFNQREDFFRFLVGTDVTWLRECSVCFRLFLAKRKKSVACLGRCASTHQKRMRRAQILVEQQWAEEASDRKYGRRRIEKDPKPEKKSSSRKRQKVRAGKGR